MANPFDGDVSAKNPLAYSPNASGPATVFFKLTDAMDNTLVEGTPVATPNLPYTIRILRCVADSTVDIQDAEGHIVTLTMTAGQIHDLAYIRAVGNVTNDKFVAYV